MTNKKNETVHEGPIPEAFSEVNPERGLVQITTPYATAVKVPVPRVLADVEADCLEEAALAGEACFYSWRAGGSLIEGGSIETAMIIARNFGNCVVDVGPVQETDEAFYFTAYFIDIQKGSTVARQFRQSKTSVVHMKTDEERKMGIRFQIGQSKAQRNVILRAVPSWLVDRMIDKAKEGVKKRISAYIAKSGVDAARQGALKILAKYGVKKNHAEAKIGKPIGKWQVEELTILEGDIKALADGAESPEALFPEIEVERAAKEAAKPDPESKVELELEKGDQTAHDGPGGSTPKPSEGDAAEADMFEKSKKGEKK